MSDKITAPVMVYIVGEEMSKAAMEMVLDKWVKPFVDTSKWQFFDLSCKNRDNTNDQVLADTIKAAAEIGSTFKEPTITPTNEQVVSMGLSKKLPSPNGKFRTGINGYTISRDTIMIPDIKLGYDNPVFMDRHAVGGEYNASYKIVPKGKSVTMFYPEDGSEPILVAERTHKDNINALVIYDNPLDNVKDMAHHFFGRCLVQDIKPFVTTKKTVFPWQEPFWDIMNNVFEKDYKDKFVAAGIYKEGEKLGHIISDDSTIKLVKWNNGKFGLAAHNYDGDVLSDELGALHKSVAFLSSVLSGVDKDGRKIMEFEASHGTVTDMYKAHLNGERTSLNPLGMVHALKGAMDHSEVLAKGNGEISKFTDIMYNAMCQQLKERGTTDIAGPDGLSTEEFIDAVARRIRKDLAFSKFVNQDSTNKSIARN